MLDRTVRIQSAALDRPLVVPTVPSKTKRAQGLTNVERVVESTLKPVWSNRNASSASSCGDGQTYAEAVAKKVNVPSARRKNIFAGDVNDFWFALGSF
jgi:hypothetical protein